MKHRLKDLMHVLHRLVEVTGLEQTPNTGKSALLVLRLSAKSGR